MDSNHDNQGDAGVPLNSSSEPDDGTGSYDRKFSGTDADGLDTGSTSEGVKAAVTGRVEAGRQKVSEAVGAGKNRVAGKIERLSTVVAEHALEMEEAGGVQRRAGQAALRASEVLDSGADYIRSRDPDEMRDDLERQIRARPLLSVGIAAGAGFLLARMLRD